MFLKIIFVLLIVFAVIADIIYIEAQQGKFSLVFDGHEVLNTVNWGFSKISDQLEDNLEDNILDKKPDKKPVPSN